ncbi:hypothetical protein KAFR_0J02660 [Kazachstania africana CBS 2517]|uniref:C2H2-type domain-containing protein n=1 Tax=Kazachstania africana (strain ATCC 22294 / BCRC 22015 / CBS 2517 / CECT 1963 / NBRC 1671 / NRRL Y-8276) TaxID=1071382 RepID=H2B130_KAZAF|nr:hypothetical protein KAFR_0J02660 [Kazachstania africana CBS 2517]CCF60330.1 hypothetical protein KAFR_0J02660 [Kazachstania africana CBS 2517]
MVTFNCEVCNDTVPKKNTEKHYYRCPNAYYTCIDCSKTFDDGVSYKQHTSCISEDEKYQKALYKGAKKGTNQKGGQKAEKPKAQPTVETKSVVAEKKVKKVESKKQPTKLVKGESLYKILRGIKDKDEKKKLLKSLIVNDSGKSLDLKKD